MRKFIVNVSKLNLIGSRAYLTIKDVVSPIAVYELNKCDLSFILGHASDFVPRIPKQSIYKFGSGRLLLHIVAMLSLHCEAIELEFVPVGVTLDQLSIIVKSFSQPCKLYINFV